MSMYKLTAKYRHLHVYVFKTSISQNKIKRDTFHIQKMADCISWVKLMASKR